jgi:capsular exopolysaccharide synthesis family protein
VSKFFKALENAEREREAQAPAAGPPLAPAAAAPPAAAVEPPSAVMEPPPAAAPARPDHAQAPPRRQPAITHPPAYGAPGAREAAGPHRRMFSGLLESPDVEEPGQLDDHLVSLLQPTSLAAEQYRSVRLHIETLHRERGVRVVAISSPSRGDGRTLSAINLAGALAQAPDARVALVEADVRHPGVARYLGLPAARGLSSYLLDPAMGVDAVVERPPTTGFAVIVAGRASSMPYELLKSPRLAALLATLRERFDYVIVDAPPVLPYPDATILRELVDAFVLVLRANRTPREMVRDSVNTLGQHRVVGLVFNDDERTAVEVDGDLAGWRAYLRPLGRSRAA